MTRFRLTALWAAVTCLAALEWVAVPPLAYAIGGIEGVFEYAIDAPWRMEPTQTRRGGLAYGAIPIQISIHDANNIGRDREGVSNLQNLALGRVCKVVVRERAGADGPGEPPTGPVTFLPFSKLDEIEYTLGRWPAPSDPQTIPAHGLCRAWNGEDCAGFDRVHGSSEWHASFTYRPSVVTPATSVSLQVEVHLTKDPLSSCEIVPDYNHVKLVNELSVYYAPAPLPRFGPEWAYGDLHYHAQGTDNEGESAYNYRGVIRAMGAMGLDFAFATEHASNSKQVIDVDANFGDIFDIEFPPAETRLGLRDMSKARFGFLHGVLHGTGGADPQAALLTSLAGSAVATPQVFLGGEVDLIPELAPGTQYGDVLPWGNGQKWSTENLCVGTLLDLGPIEIDCDTFGVDLLEQTATNPDAVLVDDIQGFSVDFGRHHIVYLPRSAADTGAFVRSNTGRYGGASRRFTHLRPELEKHGYFFAAHPFSHFERGDDFMTDPGPNDIPWTDHTYNQVWQSRAWLGLQFWNEDARLREPVPAWSAFTTADPVPSKDYCISLGPNPTGMWVYICPKPGGDVGYERYDSPILGIPYAYLPVDRAQAGFGTGLFHLKVEAPVTGRWPEYLQSVEEKLHHGAFTWDRLNHWGLNVQKTKEVDWLPSFLAPRRLFMAGGSDAHGDLNYRRTGYLIRTDAINDAALGKPRNLVEAGTFQRPPRTARAATPPVRTQTQVADAIADGKFAVTDGPALRIAIDRNGDGWINTGDGRMGDVVSLTAADRRTLPLLVEWKSTSEFGEVRRIDIYLGARASEADLAGADDVGRTYAPPGAGVHHGSIPGIGLPDPVVDDPPYDRMNDNYWKDPTGLLSFKPTDGLTGTRRIFLDLAQFPAMQNLAADRFFVRAYAVTAAADPGDICVVDHESCLRRYAFTNPIWMIDNDYVCGPKAGVDKVSPEVSCNAPATTPADRAASFAATAADVCPASVEISKVECAGPPVAGAASTPPCAVVIEGDTVTIPSGFWAGTVVRWTATATDAAGNRTSATCQTEVGG